MRVSDLSDYLKAAAISNGDIITILSKPVYIDAEESRFGRAHVEFQVRLPNGKTKTWTPNKTTLNKLAESFGDEMDDWVNESVLLTVTEQNVRGSVINVVYGKPAPEPKPEPAQEAL